MPKFGWYHAGSSNQTVPANPLPYLNWEKYEMNLKTSYASLRRTPDFSNVSLVCGVEMESK